MFYRLFPGDPQTWDRGVVNSRGIIARHGRHPEDAWRYLEQSVFFAQLKRVQPGWITEPYVRLGLHGVEVEGSASLDEEQDIRLVQTPRREQNLQGQDELEAQLVPLVQAPVEEGTSRLGSGSGYTCLWMIKTYHLRLLQTIIKKRRDPSHPKYKISVGVFVNTGLF